MYEAGQGDRAQAALAPPAAGGRRPPGGESRERETTGEGRASGAASRASVAALQQLDLADDGAVREVEAHRVLVTNLKAAHGCQRGVDLVAAVLAVALELGDGVAVDRDPGLDLAGFHRQLLVDRELQLDAPAVGGPQRRRAAERGGVGRARHEGDGGEDGDDEAEGLAQHGGGLLGDWTV